MLGYLSVSLFGVFCTILQYCLVQLSLQAANHVQDYMGEAGYKHVISAMQGAGMIAYIQY